MRDIGVNLGNLVGNIVWTLGDLGTLGDLEGP